MHLWIDRFSSVLRGYRTGLRLLLFLQIVEVPWPIRRKWDASWNNYNYIARFESVLWDIIGERAIHRHHQRSMWKLRISRWKPPQGVAAFLLSKDLQWNNLKRSSARTVDEIFRAIFWGSCTVRRSPGLQSWCNSDLEGEQKRLRRLSQKSSWICQKMTHAS